MIKITEEDIHVVYDKSGGPYVEFLSLEGNKIEWTPEDASELKNQILENQEIVERVRTKQRELQIDVQFMEKIHPKISNLNHDLHHSWSKKLEQIKEFEEMLTIEGN